MISQNGLCSCRADNPDNAIYLGREEAPEVPLAQQKNIHFFAADLCCVESPGCYSSPIQLWAIVDAVGAAFY